jgi:hypothetical protein
VSQQTNDRLMNALSSVDDSETVQNLTAGIQQPVNYHGRRVRALRPLGDDTPLLEAINRGDFLLHGFRNRDLQAIFYGGLASAGPEKRRRSAAMSMRCMSACIANDANRCALRRFLKPPPATG